MMLLHSILLPVLVVGFEVQETHALTLLGRKSTANQVYRYLDQNNQLAPHFVADRKVPGSTSTAVVTGGNSGIGAETVKTLVDAGIKVILCARNIESAKAVKDALPTKQQQDLVDVQYMDLSNLATVKDCASRIVQKYETIDCLINNAGIMALAERETTDDGIEMQWGTNHVGHHLFTRLLLPQMNSENGRIVTVASTAHTFARPPLEDWESKEGYTPWGAYGKSKLSNILFAKQLQKELDSSSARTTSKSMKGDGLCSVSLHPGVIASPLWKHSLPRFLQPMVRLISNKSVEQGAATTVYCALCRHVEGGAYYDDCSMAEPSSTAQDEQLQQDLWEYTEKLLKDKGFELPALQTKQVAAKN